MAIIGKILPKYYKYIKLSNCGSFLRSNKAVLQNSNNLKLDIQALKSLEHTQEEIAKAYRTYAQSPYINHYMRTGEPVSEAGNEIISCLNQAINTSKPTTGTFVRGINGTKAKPINDNMIGDYIFNNKGFTSTAPIEEKGFASSFALGKNSAIVEFDITKPMKAYSAGRWETIFAPNAFSSEKFEIKKIKDGYYKVVQK